MKFSTLKNDIYNLSSALESVVEICKPLTIPELLKSTLKLGIWDIKENNSDKFQPYEVYATYDTNGMWIIRIVSVG